MNFLITLFFRTILKLGIFWGFVKFFWAIGTAQGIMGGHEIIKKENPNLNKSNYN